MRALVGRHQLLHHHVHKLCSLQTGWAATSNDMVKALVECREQLEGRLENLPRSYPIRGVSFGNCQEVLSKGYPRQSLLLVREPGNLFDPNAVQIQTLEGEPVGYVPRDQTHDFSQERSLGCLQSKGQVDTGKGSILWGGHVLARPRLPGIFWTPLPASISHYASLEQHPAYDLLLQSLGRQNRGHCQVTGVQCCEDEDEGDKDRFVVVPQWRFDDIARVAAIVSLWYVCRPVAEALLVGPLGPGGEATASTELTEAINSWTREEVCTYHYWMQREAERRSREQWEVDDSGMEQYLKGFPDWQGSPHLLSIGGTF